MHWAGEKENFNSLPNILAEMLRGMLKFEEVKVCLKQRVILVGKAFFKNLKMSFFLFRANHTLEDFCRPHVIR